MNINAITKHYDKLTINERFALMQAAINRGDDTDRAALARTAPRKRWEMPNTTGLIDAFDTAAQWHMMGLSAMRGDFYYLLSLDDDLIRLVNKKDKQPLDIDELMTKLIHDVLVTCEAWRRVCSDYGVDPSRILEGLPGSEPLAIFEATIQAAAQIRPVDLGDLDTYIKDIRTVIELLRKRWE
jgi:hypothetical protein